MSILFKYTKFVVNLKKEMFENTKKKARLVSHPCRHLIRIHEKGKTSKLVTDTPLPSNKILE
jgi:hypothetical protein